MMPQHMTGGVGNSGNVTHYGHVNIEIGFFAGTPPNFLPKVSFTAYAGFTTGLESQGIGLLGQCDFFENFSVTLDHKNKVFHIE